MLSSIVAHLASHTILERVIPQLTSVKQLATSVQRIAKVTVLISTYFFHFLVGDSNKYVQILVDKIMLFANDIFDPNFRHQVSSDARVMRLIEGLS